MQVVCAFVMSGIQNHVQESDKAIQSGVRKDSLCPMLHKSNSGARHLP